MIINFIIWVDLHLLKIFLTIAHRIQDLTGIVAFRLTRWCAILSAIYAFALPLPSIFPTLWGVDPKGQTFFLYALVPNLIIALLWGSMEIHTGIRYQRIEEAWDGSPDFPREFAITFMTLTERPVVLVRFIFFPFCLSLWLVMMILSSSVADFLSHFSYVGFPLGMYFAMTFPKPRATSKVEEFLESFQAQPKTIEVES